MNNNSGSAAGAAAGLLGAGFIFLIEIALLIITIVGAWKVFAKAGKPGWAAIIPIYNAIVLLQIVGKPLWWIVLCIIPCVNFFVIIYLFIELAKYFGKGIGFAIGMFILPFIFWPILGFGGAKYTGTTTPS